MVTVNIHEAKTQLSKLVDQAVKGEAFVIAKAHALKQGMMQELLTGRIRLPLDREGVAQ